MCIIVVDSILQLIYNGNAICSKFTVNVNRTIGIPLNRNWKRILQCNTYGNAAEQSLPRHFLDSCTCHLINVSSVSTSPKWAHTSRYAHEGQVDCYSVKCYQSTLSEIKNLRNEAKYSPKYKWEEGRENFSPEIQAFAVYPKLMKRK